jgi:tetratricopeptide (TPR) repeat protein
MENSYITYERILTENNDLAFSFFETEISKSNSSYLRLMEVYKYICNDKISIAKKKIENIKLKDDCYLQSLLKMNIGLINIKEGKNEEGFKILNEAEKTDNSNKWLKLELFYYLKNKEPYKAWYYLEEAIKLDSKFYCAIIEYNSGLDSSHNCEEIIENLRKIPKTYNDPSLLNLLGVSQINCGQKDEGKISLENSLKVKETSNNTFSLGQYYHDVENDFLKAEKYYNKSIALNSNNTDAINAYSWLLFDKGEISKSEKLMLSLNELSSDQEIFNQIINFYIINKNLNEAKNQISKSKEVNDLNYMNEGYEIIVRILSNEDYKSLYSSYTTKYEEYDVTWLKDQISFFLNNK